MKRILCLLCFYVLISNFNFINVCIYQGLKSSILVCLIILMDWKIIMLVLECNHSSGILIMKGYIHQGPDFDCFLFIFWIVIGRILCFIVIFVYFLMIKYSLNWIFYYFLCFVMFKYVYLLILLIYHYLII